MKPIRVLLVDDHQVVRAGLRLLLRQAAGVDIVAEAADARAALKAVARHKPDVILLDVNLPGPSGLDLLAEISRAYPDVRVLILSVHAEEELVVQALRAGAAGYLLKDAGPEELEQAIRRVAEGQTYVATTVSQHLVRYLNRTEQQATQDVARPMLARCDARDRHRRDHERRPVEGAEAVVALVPSAALRAELGAHAATAGRGDDGRDSNDFTGSS